MMRISLLGASLLVLLAACCRADDLSTLASANLSTPTPTDVTSPASGFYFGADYLNWAARGNLDTPLKRSRFQVPSAGFEPQQRRPNRDRLPFCKRLGYWVSVHPF